MMRKMQLFLVGCLIIVTLTSLYFYNYSSYVIPVPLFKLYRSTNESLLRNVEVFPNSSGDQKMPKIGRTLSKVEHSDGGGAESMQTSLDENTKSSGNLSQNAIGKPASTSNRNASVKEVSRTLDANLAARQSTRKEDEIEGNNVTTGSKVMPGPIHGNKPAAIVVNGITQASFRSKLWLNHGRTSSCAPSKQNVAFIKTHKTGSTTLGHLINRFGYHHRLSFVLNKHSRSNGHLVYYNVTKDSPRLKFLPPVGVKIRDYKNYKYNLVAIHVRYNRPAMDSFMKPGTKYITIIRDPGSQFESAFSHFQFDDAFPSNERPKFNTTEEKLEHFFQKPILYRDRLKLLSWENTLGLRWNYARNNQAFDLGLDHKYHMNTNIVQKFIDRLEREISVVLLTEHLDESLVILRKKMCWTWSDIVYIAKNRRPEVETLPELLREKMRSWNAVDSMLYTHFNRTLWKHVEEYGPDFAKDLSLFKDMLGQVFNECVSNQYQKSQGRNFHWVEYQPRQGSSTECKLLVESKRALFRKIWARQDITRSVMLDEKTKPGQTRRDRTGYYSRIRLSQYRKASSGQVGGHPPGTKHSVLTEPGNGTETKSLKQTSQAINAQSRARQAASILRTQQQLKERLDQKRPE